METVRTADPWVRVGGVDWRFVLVGLVYGVVGIEVLYFLFRPDGFMAFGLFMDAHTVLDATRGWLAGDAYYPASQLAGPYWLGPRDILYPPQMLVLFVPFAFLPVIAFVAIPLAILVYIVWWWRPSYVAWIAIGLLLWIPTGWGAFLYGNPTIWFAAFVALATRWPAFGPLVLLKPTLAPFALVGIRHRAWWLTATAIGVVTLAFLPMLPDWLTVMRNVSASGSVDLFYNVPAVPLLLVPLVAKLSRT